MSDLISRQAAIDAITRKMVSIPTADEKDLMGDVNRIRTEDISVIKRLPSAQPETHEERTETHACDLIDRQAAIDAVDSETVSTNPEHFKSSEKFIKFMNNADISSFGKWQWANGFNTALVATTIRLKKLPSVQPEIVRCKDCKNRGDDDCPMRFIEWVEYDDDGYIEHDDIIHDYTKDDGFCDRAERRTDEVQRL